MASGGVDRTKAGEDCHTKATAELCFIADVTSPKSRAGNKRGVPAYYAHVNSKDVCGDGDWSGGEQPVDHIGDSFVFEPGLAEFAVLQFGGEVLLEQCLTPGRGNEGGAAGQGLAS